MSCVKLQIEVTNKCNLSCNYCIRNYWNTKPMDMPLHTFKQILDSFDADRLILYGFGESTIHKNFEEMLRLANSKAEVVLVTNGLRVRRFTDRIDVLAVSVKTLDGKTKSLLKDLKRRNVYASLVLTKDNLSNFLELVKWICENGINVIVSNLVPYSKDMYEKTLFVCTSRKSIEICKRIDDLNGFLKSLVHLSPLAVRLYKDMSSSVNYRLNLGYIIKNSDRIAKAKAVESILSKAKDIAEMCGVEIDLPEMFADQRKCPYEDCLFIRADGKIAPCMDLAYTHPIYLGFEGVVEGYAVEKVDELRDFIKKRCDMENFPWCGDCQFAEGCWYVCSDYDCYGNKPTCSLCLYSAGIAKCLL
jgi:MoaA/NifB/PqqE/SkfB family radical SAM enzyme